MTPPVEVTLIARTGGPLTKRVFLATDGSLRSDGTACRMGHGIARRARFSDLHTFADCIGKLAQYEAVALGSLRLDLPSEVEITTKAKLGEVNGAGRPGLIARTAGHIVYCTGQPALVLLDFDTKGMPPNVAARLDEVGGYWAALVSVLPKLAFAARMRRHSTSAGIYRTDTGEKLSGSDGSSRHTGRRDTARNCGTRHGCFLEAHGEAGYCPELRNAARLRAHPSIKARTEQLHRDRARLDQAANQQAMTKLAVSKESVGREFALVGFANMIDYTAPDADGHRVIDLDNVTREQMAAVQEMTVDYYTEGRGKDALRVKRVKIKLYPKVAALEKLARMFGWIVDGRYQQQDDELVKLTARLAAMTPEQRRADAEDVIRRARQRLAEAARDEAPTIDGQTGEPI